MCRQSILVRVRLCITRSRDYENSYSLQFNPFKTSLTLWSSVNAVFFQRKIHFSTSIARSRNFPSSFDTENFLTHLLSRTLYLQRHLSSFPAIFIARRFHIFSRPDSPGHRLKITPGFAVVWKIRRSRGVERNPRDKIDDAGRRSCYEYKPKLTIYHRVWPAFHCENTVVFQGRNYWPG